MINTVKTSQHAFRPPGPVRADALFMASSKRGKLKKKAYNNNWELFQ